MDVCGILQHGVSYDVTHETLALIVHAMGHSTGHSTTLPTGDAKV